MREYRHLIILYCFILAFTASLCQAQQSNQSPQQYWINLRSSPLRFGTLPDGDGYTLANYTNIGPIVRYRFGCVLQKHKKTIVLDKWQVQEYYFPALLPGRIFPTEEIMVTRSHGFPLEMCKKGKVAVIEAEFEDGAVWKASR